jgi:hypothetical protein
MIASASRTSCQPLVTAGMDGLRGGYRTHFSNVSGDDPLATSAASSRPAPLAQAADYVVPVIHVRVPASVGHGAFWALAGVALAGVVDPPVAALITVGFLVARGRTTGRRSAG